MKDKLRTLASDMVFLLARVFGRRITDARTGERVGKAFVFCRGGGIRLIGFKSDRALYPRFKTVKRVTYYRRELEFASHPEPDYPNEREDD